MILVVILMASGFNPIIVAVIFGLIILAATIFLSTNQLNVAGPAFVSALLIMTLLVGLILVVMTLSQTAGFGPEDSESLEGFSVYIGVSFPHILIATTLLGTLAPSLKRRLRSQPGWMKLRIKRAARALNKWVMKSLERL
jgi:uncharacterized membrane protein